MSSGGCTLLCVKREQIACLLLVLVPTLITRPFQLCQTDLVLYTSW